MKNQYDYSEFGPSKENQLDPNILKRIPGAIGQVGKDIGGLLGEIPNAIANIPKDIDYLKENIPYAYSQLKNDPARFGRGGIAGIGELAAGVSRIPPELGRYLAHIGMIKPETAEAILPHIPGLSAENVEKKAKEFVGGEPQPGDELIRGGFRNIPGIYGGAKALQYLNPLKMTSGNIAKGVLKESEKQYLEHQNMYDKLWDKAEKSGSNSVPVDINKISDNFQPIYKYKTPREYQSVINFAEEPTLSNAQKAQSDMNAMARSLEKKSKSSSLTSEEKAVYQSAKDIEKEIENNMFKNESGIINKSLKNEYDKITKSYRENVVPYKYNPDIQDYKNRKLLPKELVERLKRGEFAVKKGKAHPAIGLRETIPDVLKALGLGGFAVGGLGLGAHGGGLLLNKLLGNDNK